MVLEIARDMASAVEILRRGALHLEDKGFPGGPASGLRQALHAEEDMLVGLARSQGLTLGPARPRVK
jgi:hypothetical protein